MKKTTLLCFAIAASVLVFGGTVLAQSGAPGGTGQASLTLWSCNTGSCYSDNVDWALGKCEGTNCTPLGANPVHNEAVSGQLGDAALPPTSNVHWNVQVQSFAVSAHVFKVFGFLDIQNTGTDTAYLGSLVINLQSKNGGSQFKTVASDVTNSTVGDTATQGITCGGASSDGTTYIYTEGTGSGPLTLTDSNHDDLTALGHLYPTLAPGERKVLLYEADFNIDALNIKAGDSVRIEALVTFSNAGPRGGSGASCTNPGGTNFGTSNLSSFNDINGDGQYTVDELYYRTVPCRTSFVVPALEHDNASVIVTDPVTNVLDQPIWSIYSDGLLTDQAPGLTTVNLIGTLTVNSAKTNLGTIDGGGYGNGVATINSTGGPHTYSYVVDANATLTPNSSGDGLAGLDNCTTLVSANPDAPIIVNDPVSAASFSFSCNPNLNLKACAWPLLAVTGPPSGGGACTYTQGAWGGKVKGNNAGSYLAGNYLTVYPSGSVTIGWPAAAGHTTSHTMTFSGGTKNTYTCDRNHKNCVVSGTIPFTMVNSIEEYLPAGGPGAALDQNLTNPTDSSSGVFGGQVLTLQLNVDFGDKGVGWGSKTAPVGDVVMHLTGCEDGKKVRDILADANIVLGGGPLPTGCANVSAMTSVVTHINEFFDECKSIDGFNSTSNLSFTSN
jgi:hypothetical protein